MSPDVEELLNNATQWQKEMKKLREIALSCGLDETFKWNKPCYAFQNKNIVVIQGFKNYCAMLFFKGALLKDPDGILVKTGENTRMGRQARFTDTKEISRLAPELRACIFEAIEVEKAGVKLDTAENHIIKIPEELKAKMNKMPSFKKAFYALTPGRQRGYIFFFLQAKQPKTREARIEKYTPKILQGKGLQE